ncbi:hypothetical protein Y032_0002g956 [Ancylostoma ceylanicum]|uniref:glucuronosyltransferase n=1 Tax=Ancylostoma ceylanicum TaxID=53326 RepID=A0A016W253_9BILA|nr:hypothetical protein Y032_0002g956 [Ancylostoma ceylanicum]
MKYEEEGSKIADHLPNVHLGTWLPQNALLADPRLTVFVTHGGLGSTTELAYQGKPAILQKQMPFSDMHTQFEQLQANLYDLLAFLPP